MKIYIRTRARKDGRKSIVLDFWDGKVRRYETTNLILDGSSRDKSTLARAEAIRAKRLLEILDFKNGLSEAFGTRASFIDYAKINITVNPFAKRISTVNVLCDFLRNGELLFAEITPEWFNEFAEYCRRDRGNCVNTIYTHLASLRAILNDAFRERLIKYKPLDGVKLRKEETIRQYLTVSEFERLKIAECPNAEVRSAFLFSCYTGLRLGDVRALQWQAIQNGKIEIRQEKTGRVVMVPISAKATDILLGLPRRIPFVFRLPKSKATISAALQIWVGRAGIEKHITFHSARHTFASLLVELGEDIYTVSKLLGHSTVKVTEVYAKVNDRKLNEAVSKLP